ncbi:MAG: S8 family peptidase, partial [Arenicellales bacterium]
MSLRSSLTQAVFFSIFLAASGQTLAQPDPSSPEYQLQWGVGAINTFPAWSEGTGSGIVVASLDTGANIGHFELEGRIASGGSTGDVDSGGGHGTSVAGIIAANFNNSGMVGIAYNSTVLPVGVANSNRFAGADSAAAGFNIAASRGDVRVIAFSAGTIFAEPLNSSINNAINAGKAVFIRAGNNFQANPDVPPSVYNNFNGAGLLVGAVNSGGQIAPLSNKAGAAANVYIVAPGVDIRAPGNTSNDGFVSWTGTSVATAHAAGAAALILSQNPGLTSQQVVQIMVDSATDLGAPGVDAVYGNGLLNVGDALAPQGGMSSSSDSAGGIAVGLVALAVGGGAYYFWNKNSKAKKNLENALVFDKYDRPYIMNMDKALNTRNDTATLFNVMNMFDRQTRSIDVPVSDALSLGIHTRTSNPSDYIFLKDSDPFLEDYDVLNERDLSLNMAGKFRNGMSFNMRHNYAPSSGFDNAGGLSLSENFIWSNSYGATYMGFGSIADSMSIGYQPGQKLAFQFGANRLDDGLEHGLSSEAMMLEGSYFPTEKSSVSLRVSNLNENGSLLGGSSNGVFSVSQANTTAVGLTGKYRVFEKFSLFASFTEGFTNVDEQKGSFLQDFTGVRSQSWGAGVIGSDLFRYNDRAGIAISSPLRVSNGDVDLIVPRSLDSSRNVVSDKTRVSLTPDGKEIDLEAFYRMNLSHNTQLGT